MNNKKQILSELDVMVARALLEEIDCLKDSDKIITTYKRVSDRTNPRILPKNLGPYLGRISSVCYEELEIPFISATVISPSHKMKSGDGFYDMIEEYGYITEKQQEEIINQAQTKKDWSELKEYLDKYYGRT